MNISSIDVTITQSDLLGIIKEILKENIHVKGLKINNVDIDNDIYIYGEYSKKVNINFMAEVNLKDLKHNVLSLKIKKIKLSKIKIFNFIVDSALKKFMKDYEKYGVFIEKGIIQIDFDILCKFIPNINFKLKSITSEQVIKAEIENVNVSLKDKEVNVDVENSDTVNESQKKNKIVKHYDGYTKLRSNIVRKVPDKYEKIAQYIFIVPDIAALLVRIFKDKRVDIKTKILIGGILAYLSTPIDIVPDFVPVLGQIDDVAIAFLGLNKVINKIPKNIVLENWQGSDDIFKIVSSGVSYISSIVGEKKLVNVTELFKNGLLFVKRYNEKRKREKYTQIKKDISSIQK